jgi:16S rRNA (cytosine1402-N4)-methyltransferase
MATRHIPVMLDEVLNLLDLKKGGYYIDCTLGGGGYTFAISKIVGKNGGVLAIDMDSNAIKRAEKEIKDKKTKNIILENNNFANLEEIYKTHWLGKEGVDGIVFDLGLSSDQLEDAERGFSFKYDTSLDMAFGSTAQGSTYDLVNYSKEDKLAGILRDFGEEKFSGRIAKAIVKEKRQKPIETTGRLVEIIGEAVPAFYRNNKKYHFATKTFMALRIATNKELDNIRLALPQALSLLKKGGRIAVVSFHSLEDRMVKNFFRTESRDCICPPQLPQCVCGHKQSLKILTKKPIIPSEKEIKNNPRSRSSKLRVIEKIVD